MGFHLTEPHANRYQASACHPENAYPRSPLQQPGQRSYSPSLSRWLNRDPIGQAGGLNAYSFVNNAVAFRVDAVGLKTINTYFDALGLWNDVPGGGTHQAGANLIRDAKSNSSSARTALAQSAASRAATEGFCDGSGTFAEHSASHTYRAGGLILGQITVDMTADCEWECGSPYLDPEINICVCDCEAVCGPPIAVEFVDTFDFPRGKKDWASFWNTIFQEVADTGALIPPFKEGTPFDITGKWNDDKATDSASATLYGCDL